MTSPLSRGEDDGSLSPKRRKIRQKYTPKACVSCRRSKLKCSGQNPCQRCIDNNRRCFYSEDQTAAEVLQNLSRPALVHDAHAHAPPLHANGAASSSRRSILARTHASERQPSDAAALAPTMERRMARIELMMEALIHERGLTVTPRGHIERQEHAIDASRSDSAFSMPPLDPIHPALVDVGQPSLESMPPSLAAQMPVPELDSYIRLGERMLPFPDHAAHQRYMANFFSHIHLRHPCLKEADFAARAHHISSSRFVQIEDVYFLALNYIIFACCDAMLEKTSRFTADTVPPGWRWFQLADSIMDKHLLLSGSNDLTFIYFLLFQAVYLVSADLPGMALNVIRHACTATVHQNLHQQSSWPELEPEEVHWRVYLVWNVLIMDCCISASCGRPPSLRFEDAMVEMPGAFYERVIVPNQQYFDETAVFFEQYLSHLISWAQLVSETSNKVKYGNQDRCYFDDIVLFKQQTTKQLSDDRVKLSWWEKAALRTSMESRVMMSLLSLRCTTINMSKYVYEHDTYFRELAVQALQRARSYRSQVTNSSDVGHDMTSAIACQLLVFGALLIRVGASDPRFEYAARCRHEEDMESFEESAEILQELSVVLPYASRVRNDFQSMLVIMLDLINMYHALSSEQRSHQEWQNLVASMPTNLVDKFPYQGTSPVLQGDGEVLLGSGGVKVDIGGTGRGVLWLI